jgi:hypothetical protein
MPNQNLSMKPSYCEKTEDLVRHSCLLARDALRPYLK